MVDTTTILSVAFVAVAGTLLYVFVGTWLHMRSYPHCCDHAKQSEYFGGSIDYNSGKPWIDRESFYYIALKKRAALAAMFPINLFTFLFLVFVWLALRALILICSFCDPSGSFLFNKFGIEKLPSARGTIPTASKGNISANSANSAKCGKPRKRVCIIGGGPSGLITLKELLEFPDEFEVTLFEQHSGVGGTFANTYKNGWLTSSSTITQFSWFLTDENVFWSFDEYVAYLKKFVIKFDLAPYMRLGTKVLGADFDSKSGLWRVETAPAANGSDGKASQSLESSPHEFDALVVCCGIAHIPRIPANILASVTTANAADGADGADGVADDAEGMARIVHSSRIRDFGMFEGKKVLCVGLGESGSDIAYNICKRAESLHLVTRHGAGFVLPRFHGGIATDIDTSYAYQICRNWATAWPYTLKRNLEALYLTPFDNKASLEAAGRVNKQMVREMIDKHHVDPKLIFNRFKTKSTLFTLPMLSKKMEYRQCDIAQISFDKDRKQFDVIFDDKSDGGAKGMDGKDGKVNHYDYIACCTGFDRYFTFLTKDGNKCFDAGKGFDEAKLYKNVIDAEMDGKLAFVGYARPIIGSLIPLSELEARYVTMVMLPEGHACGVQLPEKQQMMVEIEQDVKKKEEMMRYDFLECKKKKRNLVDFLTYINEMTGLIGSQNSFATLFAYYPYLWYQALCGQIQSVHFRIFSRHNEKGRFDVEYVRKGLKDAPLMPTPVLVIEFWVYVVHYFVKKVLKR